MHILNDSERQIDFPLLETPGDSEKNIPPKVKRIVLVPTHTCTVSKEEHDKLKKIPLFKACMENGALKESKISNPVPTPGDKGVDSLME